MNYIFKESLNFGTTNYEKKISLALLAAAYIQISS